MPPNQRTGPAMNTIWYAVDKHGHIGLFNTLSGGAIPIRSYTPTLDDDPDYFDEEELEEMGEAAPTESGILNYLPNFDRLFSFNTGARDTFLSDRYERAQVPLQPIHLDELRPDLRQEMGAMRFETLDFRETEAFQPIELTECGTLDPAYLSGDGTTVKAVPGREKDYAEFIKLRRGKIEKLGLTIKDPPEKKRASPRTKKGSGGKK